MIDWENDRRVHFAIGVGLIWLALTWFLPWTFSSHSLEIAANDGYETRQVMGDDGSLRSVSEPASGIVTFVLPLIEQVIALIVALGSYAISGAFWTAGKISTAVSQSGTKATAAGPAAAREPEQDPEDLKKLLVAAAATRDATALMAVANRVRRPYAELETMDAIRSNDFETAKKRLAELEAIAGLKKKEVVLEVSDE